MWSPNKRPPTAEEARYLSVVKELPCSVCDQPGPSELHEPRQGDWWLVVALCPDCHRGSHNGIGRGIWRVKKMDELAALAVTISRAFRALASRGLPAPVMAGVTTEEGANHGQVQEGHRQGRRQARLLSSES